MLIGRGPIRTASGPTAYRHFKLNVTAGKTTDPFVYEIEVAETAAGADKFTGGTAGGNFPTPSNAFDNNTSSNTSSATAPRYVTYDLGSGNEIVPYEYRMWGTSFASGQPKDWTFEGSNDGTNWDVLDTQSGVTWSTSEYKTFVI